jgi:cytochrome P450
MNIAMEYDPFAPETVVEPFAWYEALLAAGPVHWIPSRGLWMVVGYDAVATALRDPAVFSSRLGYAALSRGHLSREVHEPNNMFDLDLDTIRMLISVDPPDHTRIRRLLSRAFTPRTVAELEPRLRSVCESMVAELANKASRGEGDFVLDLASPFPVTVIAELLDIPGERRLDFRRWSDAMSGTLSGDVDPDVAATAGAELFGFMAEVVESRRAQPGQDLISRLLVGAAEGEPDPLGLEEITMIAILLLAAGNETTTNLLGNAAAAFDAHPDQADLLWSNRELVPSAIEEVLRWQSPVQGLLRGTTGPTRLAGVDIPAGASVLICFAAANRDPAHFADPNRFDITRAATDHFAFGHGIHYCLGANLARLEARLAIEALIDGGVRLYGRGGATRTPGFILRGYSTYPVSGGTRVHA